MAETDKKPPTYDELVADNGRLRADLEASRRRERLAITALRQREGEIARLLKARRPKQELDPKSTDPYKRPFTGTFT